MLEVIVFFVSSQCAFVANGAAVVRREAEQGHDAHAAYSGAWRRDEDAELVEQFLANSSTSVVDMLDAHDILTSLAETLGIDERILTDLPVNPDSDQDSLIDDRGDKPRCVCPAKKFKGIVYPSDMKKKNHGLCVLLRMQWECGQYSDSESTCKDMAACDWSSPKDGELKCSPGVGGVFSAAALAMMAPELNTNCGEIGKHAAVFLDHILSCAAKSGNAKKEGKKVHCGDKCLKIDNPKYFYDEATETCSKPDFSQCTANKDDHDFKSAMSALGPPPMGGCEEKPWSIGKCLRKKAPSSCFWKEFACVDLKDETGCKSNSDCTWTPEKKGQTIKDCDADGNKKDTFQPTKAGHCIFNWFKKQQKGASKDEKKSPCSEKCRAKDEYKDVKCHGTEEMKFSSKGYGTTTTTTGAVKSGSRSRNAACIFTIGISISMRILQAVGAITL